MRHASILATLVLLFAAPMASLAAAQDRPRSAVEFTAGWVGFPDDGVVSETLVGGTARVYLSPRISAGPEIAYIRGDNHSHLMLTGNLNCDLLAPAAGQPRRVTPFLVAGGGLFQTREHFPTGTFTSSEGAFTAGGGVRALAGDRVILGLEARLGWELHVRVSGLVGLHLGR